MSDFHEIKNKINKTNVKIKKTWPFSFAKQPYLVANYSDFLLIAGMHVNSIRVVLIVLTSKPTSFSLGLWNCFYFLSKILWIIL